MDIGNSALEFCLRPTRQICTFWTCVAIISALTETLATHVPLPFSGAVWGDAGDASPEYFLATTLIPYVFLGLHLASLSFTSLLVTPLPSQVVVELSLSVPEVQILF